MALINCSECGKEISDQAQACIHCGAPMMLINSHELKKARFTGKTPPHNMFIILSIVALALALLFYTPSNPSSLYITAISALIFIVIDKIYVTTFYPNEDYYNPLALWIIPLYIYQRLKYFNASLTLFWVWLIVAFIDTLMIMSL